MARRPTRRTDGGLRTMTVLVGVGFVCAAASQFRLQVLFPGNTIALAEKISRYTVESTDRGKRGTVYDRTGKAVAVDDTSQVLHVQFAKIPHSDAFYMDLAAATGIPASEFAALSHGPYAGREWRTPLGPSQCDAVLAVKQDWRADGVSLRNAGMRRYSLGAAASALVGQVREGVALTGLELSKNRILEAHDGSVTGLVDKQGRMLPTRIQEQKATRKDGQPITLTIDSYLQTVAYKAVRQAVELHKAEDGVAVVIDPKTGDILAMANAPSVEPYEPDGTYGPTPDNLGYNPATMSVLEPGSTFKILTMAKAMDDGKLKITDHLYCSGEKRIGARSRIRCDLHGGTRAHGDVDTTMAIARSCNVSAATWAHSVGRERFFQFIEDLGLVRRTKLGLPKETGGLLSRTDPAQALQLAALGFGQSITTSPVALAGAFAMLGNGGLKMEPRLVAKVGNETIAPAPGTQVVSPDTSAQVLSAMEKVFSSDRGTGHSLRIPGYRLAGKTGTAQKIGKGQGGNVANFVGFVPAEDPKALILVMVNRPTAGGFYGGVVAGPAFVQIAKGVIRHFNIPPSEGPSAVRPSPPSPRVQTAVASARDR